MIHKICNISSSKDKCKNKNAKPKTENNVEITAYKANYICREYFNSLAGQMISTFGV